MIAILTHETVINRPKCAALIFVPTEGNSVRFVGLRNNKVFLCTASDGFRRVRIISKSDCQLRHVRLSVRTEQLGSHWTDFDET